MMAETGVGRVIDNKYEILTSIGRGGMSYVWLGRDKRLDKMWAIKEFRPSAVSSQGAANRQAIIDEANFIKRLDHPAIPRVVDIIDTGASIFVVMDFIDGTALNKVLRQQGTPFEQERVIEWGIELCEVLEYLHGLSAPVVYRDMKPSNIMLRGDDSVKLIDFGISMELLPSGPSDTRVIGTGGYGAPEQVDKEIHRVVPVDTRADIYALGATLYSLVTGHTPRTRKTETGKSVIEFEMRPIREWNGQLSEGLEHILQRATQVDPANRYQTVAEMRNDLEHYEELTEEYREAQRRKVRGFRFRVIASGVVLLVGVLCLILSYAVRNSSYDTLIHEASVASTEERNVQIEVSEEGIHTRSADSSEAEELYTRAIEVNPANIETFEKLIDLYEADSLFTVTEARRWTELWQTYGQQLESNPGYGKLCYDVGILYLVYYDYMDARSITGENTTEAATGQGAVENAVKSMRWFRIAKSHPESLSDKELNAAERYEVLGSFYESVAKANREGADASDDYERFWNTLEETIVGTDDAAPLIADSEDIVKLRIYQVAFESVSSSTYLTGFRRAGVSKERADAMLTTVCENTKNEASFVEVNRDAAGFLYDEIINGEEDARANITRVYKNALVQPSNTDEKEG